MHVSAHLNSLYLPNKHVCETTMHHCIRDLHLSWIFIVHLLQSGCQSILMHHIRPTLGKAWYDVKTRKLCNREDDCAMHFCCAILMQYLYDPAITVRSSDVNKGAWQMPCRNYGLRPSPPLVSQNFSMFPGSRWLIFGLRRAKTLA